MWSLRVDLRAQRLAQHYGYAVLRCDNRGSARRGLQFERAIKWQMGDVELADQVDITLLSSLFHPCYIVFVVCLFVDVGDSVAMLCPPFFL